MASRVVRIPPVNVASLSEPTTVVHGEESSGLVACAVYIGFYGLRSFHENRVEHRRVFALE